MRSGSIARKQFKIYAVETLAPLEKFAHLAIDRRGALRMRNAGLDQDRLGSRFRREIAFVADAGDLVAKSQRKQNLSRRRQQGANLHASKFNMEMIPLRLLPG